MSDLKLVYSGQSADLDLTGHRLSIVSGTEAIDQQLKIRLRTFLGEWALDQNIGFPYYRDVLGKKAPDLSLIKSLYRKTILSTPGVVEVTEISVELDSATRTLNLYFRAVVDTDEVLIYAPFTIAL
jgi:hypothetical protein